ncbi:MAG: cytochrome P450 [Chloroflexota bacterium]|nr:MAG: cytochrome P450 [Chloroflexota bacterium]
MLGQTNSKNNLSLGSFFDAEFLANPYPYFEQQRERGSVVPLQKVFGRKMWLVTRYEEAVMVLKDQRFSVNWGQMFSSPIARIARRMSGFSRFDLSQSMVGMDEPDHTRLRTLVSKAFTPRFVENLRPRIQLLADELLDRVQSQGEMDLVNDFAYPLPINVISEMLGIPQDSRDQIKIWSQMIAGASMPRWNFRPQTQMDAFADFVERLAAEKRRNPQDDLISQLVQIEESGSRLSEDELISMIMLLIFAGHETTSNLIGLGMLALFDHPDQLARLKADSSLIPMAVEEMLRFSGPVTSPAPRFAQEDVEVGGQRIRKGEIVIVALSFANRDSQQFIQADTMDIARTANRHIAFGQGIHYCLGAPLARLEGDIAFSTLLKRMPNIHLNIARDAVKWRGGMSLRGLVTLPVAF